MKAQVRITRTDNGANTKVKSEQGEASKDYGTWDEALSEAERLGLMNAAEQTAAKILPPGMPYHTNTEVSVETLTSAGFTPGKATPAQ